MFNIYLYIYIYDIYIIHIYIIHIIYITYTIYSIITIVLLFSSTDQQGTSWITAPRLSLALR